MADITVVAQLVYEGRPNQRNQMEDRTLMQMPLQHSKSDC